MEAPDVYERITHLFIVKVWREEPETALPQATWRGHITYVPTGEILHLQKLSDITAFIGSFLERIELEIDRSRPG